MKEVMKKMELYYTLRIVTETKEAFLTTRNGKYERQVQGGCDKVVKALIELIRIDVEECRRNYIKTEENYAIK